jgi:hypothetical protein
MRMPVGEKLSHWWTPIQAISGVYCAVLATWELRIAPAGTGNSAVPSVGTDTVMRIPTYLFIGIVVLGLSVAIPAVLNFVRRDKKDSGDPVRQVSSVKGAPETKTFLSPIQIECISIARELKQFLMEMPPPDSNVIELMRQSRDVLDWYGRLAQRPEQMQAWSNQLGHAYASQFSAKVTALIHDLGAKGVDISALEPYQKWVGSDDNVNAAIRALRQLAFEVEDRDETRIPRRSKG